MEFNTQVCTTREQSERLFALGLKKDTADMCLDDVLGEDTWIPIAVCAVFRSQVPAWSLCRLMELCPKSIFLEDYPETIYYFTIDPYMVTYEKEDMGTLKRCERGNVFDRMVDMVEWLIKNNHFNKEYLE